jgi:hypothetical protein
MLQTENGDWVSDKSQLELMVTSFYKNLFTDDVLDDPFCLTGKFPPLSSFHYDCLIRGVSFEEVKHVVFGIGGLKASSPNGFQALFYQSQWDSIGDTIFKMVSDIFFRIF